MNFEIKDWKSLVNLGIIIVVAIAVMVLLIFINRKCFKRLKEKHKNLHLQLLELPIGEHYRQTFSRVAPELPRLRLILGKERAEMSDTELQFRALYAAMLYRIKGEGEKSPVSDTLALISPSIGELAALYGKVERGEIDLFKSE